METIVESPLIRSKYNPILSSNDLNYPSNLVFNAGVVKFRGRYIMAFRNDYNYSKLMFDNFLLGKGSLHAPSSNIGIAYSYDGIHWKPNTEPSLELENEEIRRIYDPRLTVIEDRCYITFAIDTKFQDNRCGIAITDDFEHFELISVTPPNNRNVLLFPSKINGLYYRLERPFNGNNGDIWISSSPDMIHWGNWQRLLCSKRLQFCNSKIGPGAPPIKTEKGWLTTFHTVTESEELFYSWSGDWNRKYCMGIMLLDLDNPAEIIGIYDKPLLKPEMDYELKGFRGNVVFPGGMILEESGEVKIYYGAADTVECMATAHVDDLLSLCL